MNFLSPVRSWTAPAVAALLAACTPQADTAPPPPAAPALVTPAAAPAVHPESGLRVVPLTITQGDRQHLFRVEIAASPEEQWMGLRFRDAMGPEEGMIFPREPARIATFTMQNTEIPLDLIFIGADGVIDSIITDTTPFAYGPFVSEQPAAAVLELNGGTAARLGIAPGAKVEW